MTSRALREATRSTVPRERPLGAHRIFRLRVGHFLLALLWFLAHELPRGLTLERAFVAVLYACIWYLAIRWTLLRESRAAPSWAYTIVRSVEGSLIAGVVILSTQAVWETGDSLSSELGAIAAMSAITLLWQSAVAGHHALGEPLRTVVVGPPDIVRMIENETVAPGARPFVLVGWIDDGGDRAEREGLKTRWLGSIEDVEPIVYGGGVDLFVVGMKAGRPALYGRLLELTHLDFSVMEFSPFFERTFGRVPLEDLSPTWFLHTMHLHRRDEESMTKRMLDVALALVGLVLAAPILTVAAIAVRRNGGPGPIIFRQVRIGDHGRQFTMMKFRSMRNDISNDGTTWTGEDDPRITGVGRTLRRFRIDELPQLVNVLRGEMAIVGPRPETPGYVKWLAEEIPFYKPRHFTKPGITGWAQVCAGYASSVDDTRTKLSYDLYYLRNRSLSLDLAIMLRTVATVLGGFGSK
jgi:exopolysaccharide biosynthesis polyprenyl glycosylphosphotransferase